MGRAILGRRRLYFLHLPLRVFLQDGRNDNRALNDNGTYDETRDWFIQNVRLMEALTKKGYDVNYA